MATSSKFDTAQAAMFERTLYLHGSDTVHGGTTYQAIHREKDEVFDKDYGGYVIKETFEFLIAEAPAEGVTITHDGNTFRTEALVRFKPHSHRMAVARLT